MRAALLSVVVVAVLVVPGVALMQPRTPSVDAYAQIFSFNSHVRHSQFAAQCVALHGTLPGTVDDSGMSREVCRVNDADFVSVGFCGETAWNFMRIRHVAGDLAPSIRGEAAAMTRALGVQPTHDLVSLVSWRTATSACQIEATARDGRTPASIAWRCMTSGTPPCYVPSSFADP